jgi:sporulation protein YlmC with PRC-barrel domain
MEKIMATGKQKVIYGSKVNETTVANMAGQCIGHIEDLAIDKDTGDIAYAVLSFGGFLGMGEHFHAVPWSALKYDAEKNGYVISLSSDELKAAPTYGKTAFKQLRDSDENFPHNIFAYYGIYT